VISIFAPAGIPEIGPGTPLADLVARAVAADPGGPLQDGDVVVVTSKVVSKVEGRARPAGERAAAIRGETRSTVARRGETDIVRTATGLTIAAAGVDASNVPSGSVLLLPADPDASAARLRHDLQQATGCRLAVVVSDTAGRPWRIGQTDHAIGAAGFRVLHSYAGRRDSYGNELRVTEVALADEVAAAADLVKGKLSGRPVAVVRGLAEHVLPDTEPDRAADLVRPLIDDLFSHGRREAVLAAALDALGIPDRYEEVVSLAGEDLVAAVTAGRPREEADVVARMLRAAARPASPADPSDKSG